MGVWGAGADPLAIDPWDIMLEMRPAVEAWFNARIQIIDPATIGTTAYNAFTDEGADTEPGVLWDSEADGALIQAIRTTVASDLGGQSVAVVGVRVQCFVPPEVSLRDGLLIKVLDGGNDHQLVNYRYVLSGGISSSHAWGHILHALVAGS